MACPIDGRLVKQVDVDDSQLEVVDTFCYLGDTILQGGTKNVYTYMLNTLTSHKSHFLLILEGKTYINEKVIHERVYFSVCPP